MSKQRQSRNEQVVIDPPVSLSRDQLAAASLEELEELHGRLKLERSVVVDNSDTDPTPWEIELAYVERAIEAQRQFRSVTPRQFWN